MLREAESDGENQTFSEFTVGVGIRHPLDLKPG
jgi:hypothetical protein